MVQNIGGMPVPMNVAGYGYTPDGARVVKELSGGASTTIYPTKSYETDGTTTTIRLFLGSQEVGTVEKVGAGAATRRYIHPDNLGGSRVITDSAGNNAQTLYYQPFGEIRVNNKTGTYDEKRKYTGHLHDDETNLEFMEARYYNAQWGRFTSEDPLFLQIGANQESAKLLSDPQSLNSYAYARNNPLKYVDPDGRVAVIPILITVLIALFIPQATNAPDIGTPIQSTPSTAQISLAAGVAGATANVVAGPVSAALGAPGLGNAMLTGGVTGMTAGTTGRMTMGQMPTIEGMAADFVTGGIAGAAGYGAGKLLPVPDWIGGGNKNSSPRPAGVPDDWISVPSDKGGGIKYKNPNNPHDYVRMMPGKPDSPNLAQQKPYAVQMRNGKALDVMGNPVSSKSPEAHVPQKDFKFNP